MIKDIRFVILIALVIISAYLLVSPYIFKSSGVVVSFIGDKSNCAGLKDGNVITQVEGEIINTEEDFKNALATILKENSVTMVANGNPINCVAGENGDIGIVVRKVDNSVLKFGIDIEGGTRVLLKPKTDRMDVNIEETINTLNNRINFYGLREIHVSSIGQDLIQIEMAGATGDEIKNFLAKQGKFEGKLSEFIKIVNNTGKLIVGGNTHQIHLVDDKIEVNGSRYSVNESFFMESLKVDVMNMTGNSVILLVNIFTGDDVTAVFTDSQNSRITQVEGGFEFVFTIQTSKESADRFAKATKGQPVQFGGDQKYIEPKLLLLLDSRPVSELNIVANLAGQSLTKASIQGFEQTRSDAIKEKNRLESTLRSGSLPVELEIVKVDTITQTAGKELINSTFYVALAAVLAVSVIIFIRYRDFKISIPMIMISFSEILIILGFAAMTQFFTNGGGWVLDIPAIAGLIAIIGVGVNQLIIITDQLLLEMEQSVKYRHKTAMSIIFNSAYTVMAAMVPLLVLGVGTLRGFAIVTILGVLVAILITRPAYMAILEKVKKLEEFS